MSSPSDQLRVTYRRCCFCGTSSLYSFQARTSAGGKSMGTKSYEVPAKATLRDSGHSTFLSDNRNMNLFAPLPENKRKFYGLLGVALCLLFAAFFLAFRAAGEKDTASRQQTSFGIIAQCERRGRGGVDNYCHYTFPVGDEEYIGVNQAASGLEFGQTVVVY